MGDVFIPKSNTTLMLTTCWSMRKHLQLFLQWKLISVYELARFQNMVADYYIRKLQSSLIQDVAGEPNLIEKDLSQQQLDSLFCLVNLQDHFPPDLRKWYYQQANALGTFKSLDRLRKLLDQYLEHSRKATVVDLSNSIIHQLQVGNQNIMVSDGDYVAGNKIIQGDEVHGDKIGGDKNH